tara:strand:+ start:3938 stop:5626 length:1689 start_codon:yes stop_codon:yes gene_type:complete
MKYTFSKIYITTIALVVSIIPFYYNNQKEATYLSIVLIIIILVSYNYLFKNNFHFDIKLNHLSIILGLTFFAILSQNIYLNFETIDWDVASYLVASQDIANGNVPNQYQWESKGPVLFYFYYLLMLFAGKNFLIFKLLNDLILIVITIFLYLTIYELSNKNKLKSIFSSLLFLVLMSQSWAVGEFSEIYSLFFISCASYLMVAKISDRYKYIFIGTLLALSTLVNQGTILFVLPILHYIFLDTRGKNLKNGLIKFITPGIIIHLLFLLYYSYHSILDVYITTYIQIPLGYIQSNYANLYELKVFFRSFYESYHPIYFALLCILIFLITQLFTLFNRLSNYVNDWIITFLITSVIFYYVGSHNYYHHLIFFLFAISLSVIKIPNSQSLLIYSFISIASVLLIIQDGNQAVYNLKNTESLFEDYPLRKLSQEIDMQFQNDYTVLALDHTLILYYLDKPNYTYIIHPSNHAEDYIVKTLASLGKINENYLEEILLYEDPDVILCSARMIVKGNPTKNTLFNCAVDDYRKEYIKLDTTKYEQNLNLSYYVDPYREINVYIKKPVDS